MMVAAISRRTVLVVAAFLGQACFAQNSGQSKVIASIQRTAVAALNFREADAAGFSRARANFTADGWNDFLTHMQGFLDSKGAPTFTSSFAVKHDARFLDERNGLLHVRIPGSLTQSSKLGRTVYDRAAIAVYVDNDGKIERLEQVTCSGASKACE